MTPRQQWTYRILLFIVFIMVIPLVIFYSFGYRISSDLKIVKTGGIYVTNKESDVSVLLNGKLKKASGILDRNILIQNIKPGSYKVNVVRDGYRPWEKHVKVQEHMVEVCFPLLIPAELKPVEIPKYLPVDKTKVKKGSRKLRPELNDDYKDVMEIFNPPKKTSKSFFPTWTSKEIAALKLGPMRRLKGKVFLTKEGNSIYVRWIGKKNQLPFFINTMSKKLVYSPDKIITGIDFFPGRDDSFLVMFEDNSLYAVEIDTRFGTHNSYKLLKYCTRFVVSGDILFFFSGDKLYKIDFET
jgi:hypothetical protein